MCYPLVAISLIVFSDTIHILAFFLAHVFYFLMHVAKSLIISTSIDLRRITAFMEERFSRHDNKLDALGQGIQGLQLTLDSRMTTQSVSTEVVLEWIAAVFTKEDYERALAARVEATCDWILKRPELLTWVTSIDTRVMSRILWVYGPAGFGKSIICARLIHYLQNELHKLVAFFFCSFTDDLKRQPHSILRSWIAQLIIQRDDVGEAAKQAYLKRRSSEATEQDLWNLFVSFNELIKDCVFVVDGYDECTTETPGLKSHAISSSRSAFVRSFINFTKDLSSSLLIVSREDHDIREQLASAESTLKTHKILRLCITQNDTRDDLKSFSNSLIQQRLPNKTAELRHNLAKTAAEKCDGMFLWLRLLQERLSPGKNARQLERMVVDTPVGLEQAYERDLQAIHDLTQDERDRAIKILWWMLYAIRPLSVCELTEAVLIEPDDGQATYPSEELPDAYDQWYIDDQLRRLCGSLIDVRPREGCLEIASYTVQFVHFSVKEYLSKALQEQFPATHGISMSDTAGNNDLLAQHCLRYLCYDNFIQDSTSTDEEFYRKVRKYAFLRYASNSWDTHISLGKPPSSNSIALCNRLHDPSISRWRSYSEMLLEGSEGFSMCLTEHRGSWLEPLHLAILTSLTEIVEHVIKTGANLNALVGPRKKTALSVAICRREYSMAMLLLDHGADVNISDAHGRTCLHEAVEKTQVDLVQVLIDKGAKVNARDNHGCTALLVAADYGHIEIVNILMDHGADSTIGTKSGKSCLLVAAKSGYSKVVEVLLRRGADAIPMNVLGNDSWGRNSLHVSCAIGNEELVTLLLEHGCDVNTADYLGRTPLIFSLRTPALISKLFLAGANINQVDCEGKTALHYAFRSISDRLQGNSPIKKPKITPSTTLDTLSASEQVIIPTLLHHGAEPSQRDHYGWSSIDWAAWHPTLLALLLPPDAIYHPPEEAEVLHIRHLSLKPAVKHLVYLHNLKPQPDTYTLSTCYNHVGRLLLASNQRDDARTASMASAEKDEDSNKPSYPAVCDICDADIIGDRHICETCADIDLCGNCLESYKLDPESPPARLGLMIQNCKGHDFFRISEDEWRKLPKGMVNGRGETKAAFVERLAKTFT